jgi:CDP-2,3-bis-(O-geranylgeranyl)-sn-glycerol synthase
MEISRLLLLIAPAYAANMAPPFARYFVRWNAPISERWLGAHKTVLGAVFGLAAALAAAFALSRAGVTACSSWLAWGFVLGAGAVGGDALKSLFKRRLGIQPGAPWIPFDQLDFMVIPCAFLWSSGCVDAMDVLVMTAFTFFADIVVNHASFALGIRLTRW